MNAPIHMLRLGKYPLDSESSGFVEHIAEQDGVQEVVVFPDSFTKDKYLGTGYRTEIPSSVAIATNPDVLYPQFRSRGFGSGMGIMALPAHRSDGVDVVSFSKQLFEQLCYSHLYYLFFRLRLPLLAECYDLSLEELHRVVMGGVEQLPERFSFRNKSSIFLHDGINGKVTEDDFKQYFSKKWLWQRTTRLRYSLGRYLGGNHFLEVGYLTNRAPNAFGVTDGQLAVLYHGGSEALEDIVRPDLRDHYIRRPDFQFARRGSEMYQASLAAQIALAHYCQAYRLATAEIVRGLSTSFFGEKAPRLLLDNMHNFIMKESILEGESMVYRHNAVRLRPRTHAIVSGNFNHPSYIVEGGTGVEETLYSVDHGLGRVLDLARELNEETGATVELYRPRHGLRARISNSRKTTSLVKNEAISEYFDMMGKRKILSPVIEFTPLVNLKYSK